MTLTDEERAKQVADWDAEVEQAKTDLGRYQAAGNIEKAAEAEKRIATFRKLRAELLAKPQR